MEGTRTNCHLKLSWLEKWLNESQLDVSLVTEVETIVKELANKFRLNVKAIELDSTPEETIEPTQRVLKMTAEINQTIDATPQVKDLDRLIEELSPSPTKNIFSPKSTPDSGNWELKSTSNESIDKMPKRIVISHEKLPTPTDNILNASATVAPTCLNLRIYFNNKNIRNSLPNLTENKEHDDYRRNSVEIPSRTASTTYTSQSEEELKQLSPFSSRSNTPTNEISQKTQLQSDILDCTLTKEPESDSNLQKQPEMSNENVSYPERKDLIRRYTVEPTNHDETNKDGFIIRKLIKNKFRNAMAYFYEKNLKRKNDNAFAEVNQNFCRWLQESQEALNNREVVKVFKNSSNLNLNNEKLIENERECLENSNFVCENSNVNLSLPVSNGCNSNLKTLQTLPISTNCESKVNKSLPNFQLTHSKMGESSRNSCSTMEKQFDFSESLKFFNEKQKESSNLDYSDNCFSKNKNSIDSNKTKLNILDNKTTQNNVHSYINDNLNKFSLQQPTDKTIKNNSSIKNNVEIDNSLQNEDTKVIKKRSVSFANDNVNASLKNTGNKSYIDLNKTKLNGVDNKTTENNSLSCINDNFSDFLLRKTTDKSIKKNSSIKNNVETNNSPQNKDIKTMKKRVVSFADEHVNGVLKNAEYKINNSHSIYNNPDFTKSAQNTKNKIAENSSNENDSVDKSINNTESEIDNNQPSKNNNDSINSENKIVIYEFPKVTSNFITSNYKIVENELVFVKDEAEMVENQINCAALLPHTEHKIYYKNEVDFTGLPTETANDNNLLNETFLLNCSPTVKMLIQSFERECNAMLDETEAKLYSKSFTEGTAKKKNLQADNSWIIKSLENIFASLSEFPALGPAPKDYSLGEKLQDIYLAAIDEKNSKGDKFDVLNQSFYYETEFSDQIKVNRLSKTLPCNLEEPNTSHCVQNKVISQSLHEDNNCLVDIQHKEDIFRQEDPKCSAANQKHKNDNNRLVSSSSVGTSDISTLVSRPVSYASILNKKDKNSVSYATIPEEDDSINDNTMGNASAKLFETSSFDCTFDKDVLNSSKYDDRMKSLVQDKQRQEQIIIQAGKALSLCKVNKKFALGEEEVEAERLILIATRKRKALQEEIHKLYERIEDETLHAKIIISDILFPLNEDPKNNAKKPENDSKTWFVCLVRHGIDLHATEAVFKDSNTFVTFDNAFTFENVSPDFEINVTLYGLTHRNTKRRSMRRKTLGDDQNKSVKKTSSRWSFKSPQKDVLIHRSSFSQLGQITVRMRNLTQTETTGFFTLNAFGDELAGSVHMKLKKVVEIDQWVKGFLNVGFETKEFLTWSRRWCHLKETTIFCWNYPREEDNEEKPEECIELTLCQQENLEKANREFCTRPRCIILELLNEPKEKASAVRKPAGAIEKIYLQMDTNQELIKWQQKINNVLRITHAWRMRKTSSETYV